MGMAYSNTIVVMIVKQYKQKSKLSEYSSLVPISFYKKNLNSSPMTNYLKGARTLEVQLPPLMPTFNRSCFWGKNNSYSIICKPFLLSGA